MQSLLPNQSSNMSASNIKEATTSISLEPMSNLTRQGTHISSFSGMGVVEFKRKVKLLIEAMMTSARSIASKGIKTTDFGKYPYIEEEVLTYRNDDLIPSEDDFDTYEELKKDAFSGVFPLLETICKPNGKSVQLLNIENFNIVDLNCYGRIKRSWSNIISKPVFNDIDVTNLKMMVELILREWNIKMRLIFAGSPLLNEHLIWIKTNSREENGTCDWDGIPDFFSFGKFDGYYIKQTPSIVLRILEMLIGDFLGQIYEGRPYVITEFGTKGPNNVIEMLIEKFKRTNSRISSHLDACFVVKTISASGKQGPMNLTLLALNNNILDTPSFDNLTRGDNEYRRELQKKYKKLISGPAIAESSIMDSSSAVSAEDPYAIGEQMPMPMQQQADANSSSNSLSKSKMPSKYEERPMKRAPFMDNTIRKNSATKGSQGRGYNLFKTPGTDSGGGSRSKKRRQNKILSKKIINRPKRSANKSYKKSYKTSIKKRRTIKIKHNK